MFVLASSSKRAVGFGGVSSSDFLSPPVSARHLSGVCVCGACGRQVHRRGSAFTIGLSGRAGSPPASCKSTNVASWRILLLLYLRSVLCFMEMSGRSWGRRHWVPGNEFIF